MHRRGEMHRREEMHRRGGRQSPRGRRMGGGRPRRGQTPDSARTKARARTIGAPPATIQTIRGTGIPPRGRSSGGGRLGASTRPPGRDSLRLSRWLLHTVAISLSRWLTLEVWDPAWTFQCKERCCSQIMEGDNPWEGTPSAVGSDGHREYIMIEPVPTEGIVTKDHSLTLQQSVRKPENQRGLAGANLMPPKESPPPMII